jgi:phosphoribosylaminoimidazole carboxylase/phosphoribosylaminoimidazole-succinocarboxamide synthase
MTLTDEATRLAEGKTKIILADTDGSVLIRSKDDITAGDGARHDLMEGKAALATATTCNVFYLLERAGIATHFRAKVDDNTFRARQCQMIPLELVTRRVATGSYLRRFPQVAEGTRFVPALVEFFLKDDARHDPQISEADIIADGHLSAAELDHVKTTVVRVFETLERAWALQDVTLVDLKVEFGRATDDHELLLADVIDNDSWRIWPGGDKSAMKDKQLYRDQGAEALEALLDNYRWVAEKTELFVSLGKGRVVVFIGANAEEKTGRSILKVLETFGVEGHLRVASADKDPLRLLSLVQEYDAAGRPVVYVAVAGRSLAMGSALDGLTPNPVIVCSPPTDRFGGLDILSSMCVAAGMASTNVLEADTAALAAVKTLSVQDPALWGRLRAHYDRLQQMLRAQDERLGADTAPPPGPPPPERSAKPRKGLAKGK